MSAEADGRSLRETFLAFSSTILITTMRYKALQSLKVKSTHSNGWWRAMREIASDPECANMKYAHRLARLHGTMMDYDFHSARILSVDRRSWKSHTKCRHQWGKHEVPVFESISSFFFMWQSSLDIDHNRKWIMECLRQKTTCIFNCHNDAPLELALDKLSEAGICTVHDLGQGYREVTLKKQINHTHGSAPEKNHPRKKQTPHKYMINKMF